MNINSTESEHGLDVLEVNSYLFDFFTVYNLAVCGEIIGIFGIIGNVCNILIFYKQGFSDSVTVTLTALAVIDIGALVTLQGYNIMVNIWSFKTDLDFDLYDMMAVFSFYPHGYFIRTSGLITMFAAFERCMSVILPLKVKLIFTRKVALIVNVSIFIVLSMYLFPIYYVLEFGYDYLPENRTYFTTFYRNNPDQVLHISYLLTDMAVPYLTFLVTMMCTIIITVRLKSRAKWRTSVSSTGQRHKQNVDSSKENKTAVMLVTVSVIFVVCLVPHSAMLTALSIIRELKYGGLYFDVACLCYTFTFLLETINCSVSCIVYYKMSSKYRGVAQEMFNFLSTKQ